MRLAVGLCPDPLGRSSPDPLAVIRGGNGKERIGNREGEEGRDGRKWRDDRER